MFTEYLDCEIEIQPRKGNAYPFSIHAPGGDARGSLRLPTGEAYQALMGKLAKLQADEDALTQIGKLLFAALFQGPVKEVLVRSQGRLQPDQGLRLVLNIASTEQEVGVLPWEFLYDPDAAGPMAMLDTPIVRYLQQSALIPRLKTDLPLRMLLTGAQPGELQKINVEQELQEIEAALADLVDPRHIQLTVEPHLTRGRLQQLLRQGFHIWHFAGHGGFGRDGKTSALAFEDTRGDLEWASALELGILLNRSSVRLIVLDACESGQLAIEPFRGMAPALIRGQIPAVIAMQFNVPDASARAFAGEFYRALAEGLPIDACVTEGRKAVMGVVGLGRADWGIPVVYTRAPDGKLFDLPAATVPVPMQPQPDLASRPVDNAARQAEERAIEMSAIQDQITMKRRQLNARKLQEAKMGINTDPMIKIDIEDLDREITKLQRQLKDLGGA
ncbi:MAG: CHAT domain-containing protein [Roseiflexaceae bacterium]